MYSKVNNLFICGAIFFNHESPRRSKEYVTTKIIKGVCAIFIMANKNIYI